MKHTLKITIVLLTLFLFAQFVGIAILYNYIDVEKSTAEETVFEELPIIERPEMEESTSLIFVVFAILIGTALALLLIKLKLNKIWKIWFFIAISVTLTIGFNAFIPFIIAGVLALVLAVWRTFKPNLLVHTITEMFVYGGLAAIFVPLFNLWAVIVLLVLIAIYDAYAVWKSKHMITLAKSQSKAKVFAGLVIPYSIPKKVKKKVKRKLPVKVRTAILGGGDIGFPLIFAGVILKELGLWQAFVIPFFAALGLGVLLWKSKEKKFYPAMPFISAGCFLGLLVVWLIGMI